MVNTTKSTSGSSTLSDLNRRFVFIVMGPAWLGYVSTWSYPRSPCSDCQGVCCARPNALSTNSQHGFAPILLARRGHGDGVLPNTDLLQADDDRVLETPRTLSEQRLLQRWKISSCDRIRRSTGPVFTSPGDALERTLSGGPDLPRSLRSASTCANIFTKYVRQAGSTFERKNGRPRRHHDPPKDATLTVSIQPGVEPNHLLGMNASSLTHRLWQRALSRAAARRWRLAPRRL